jgi:hypothetical protein
MRRRRSTCHLSSISFQKILTFLDQQVKTQRQKVCYFSERNIGSKKAHCQHSRTIHVFPIWGVHRLTSPVRPTTRRSTKRARNSKPLRTIAQPTSPLPLPFSVASQQGKEEWTKGRSDRAKAHTPHHLSPSPPISIFFLLLLLLAPPTPPRLAVTTNRNSPIQTYSSSFAPSPSAAHSSLRRRRTSLLPPGGGCGR